MTNIMQVLKTKMVSYVLLLLFAVSPLFVSTPVVADHTIQHCVEQTNSDTNAEFDACVAGIPDEEDDDGPGLDVGVDQVDDRPMCPDGTPGISVSPSTDPSGCIPFDEENASLEDNPIFDILGNVIQFLLAAVGIGLTAVIVIAGFQYMTANGDPQKVSSARKKIGFAITGVILYVFAGAILNFLVPGGII